MGIEEWLISLSIEVVGGIIILMIAAFPVSLLWNWVQTKSFSFRTPIITTTTQIAIAVMFVVLLFIFFFLSAIQVQKQNEESTATPSSVGTATPSPVPTATLSPVPTVTPSPVSTATPSPVSTVTSSPVPTVTSSPVPTVTSSPVPTATSSPVPTATSSPIPLPTPTPENTISILEVMANPCGIGFDNDFIENEYVELYNYGTNDIDVGGWWISDDEYLSGSSGEIVAWGTKNPGIYIGNGETTSTDIPPGGYGIILSPWYRNNHQYDTNPYYFPLDTVLLTVRDGKHLGSDDHGLEVRGQQDTVTLYIGTLSIRDTIVSRYMGRLILDDCESAERQIHNDNDWQIQNWVDHTDGTPGESCICPSEMSADE